MRGTTKSACTLGTYTQGDSEGIYVYRLSASSGELKFESKATGVESPSFLALHPEHRYLYAVNAVREVDGKPNGCVSAFGHQSGVGRVGVLESPTFGWARALSSEC